MGHDCRRDGDTFPSLESIGRTAYSSDGDVATVTQAVVGLTFKLSLGRSLSPDELRQSLAQRGAAAWVGRVEPGETEHLQERSGRQPASKGGLDVPQTFTTYAGYSPRA